MLGGMFIRIMKELQSEEEKRRFIDLVYEY